MYHPLADSMSVTLIKLSILLSCLLPSIKASAPPGVLSIPPSLYWDGADGSWSTFQIQIGTPGQTVRLLPSTSANAGNSLWAVIPEGCTIANPSIPNCSNERGYLFTSNQSSSWSISRLQNGGLYELDLFEERFLGLSGNAYYGFDTIQLGIEGSGLSVLQDQLVAGIATNDFWLGSLGLSPIPFNFTTLNEPLPTLLSTLRNQTLIGSTSWAYTAGASYRDPPVHGSLTLGGYDTARFNASATFPFGADFSRDLLVPLTSITTNTYGSPPLLSQIIHVFINSLVPSLYLPISVCQNFERAFNLTWNATAELYLLTSHQHETLLAQNPSLTFTLRSDSAEGIDITLPYAAFDLNITRPYVEEESYYFPLKRASNDSQYTLGRVFLQEAYVIADYDRHEFRVAQALFPSTEAEQQLQALAPPIENTTAVIVTRPGEKVVLGAGVIAGIVVGAIVLIALLTISGILWVRRRRRRHYTDVSTDIVMEHKDENVPSQGLHSEGKASAVHELGIKPHLPPELANTQRHGNELAASETSAVEIDGKAVVSELEDSRMMPVELEAPTTKIRGRKEA
ncbi:hypothetical protein LTS10_006408 [Elasticomyces elasticus]|nr:hypothetical protein LTS10_006408 [Elasticomyces elasticus]